MLKIGYSRRSNNMIRKRIPRINNIVTEKMTVSTWNNVTLIEFHATASGITHNGTFEKYIDMNTNPIIEYFVTHYQIRLNSSTVYTV